MDVVFFFHGKIHPPNNQNGDTASVNENGWF